MDDEPVQTPDQEQAVHDEQQDVKPDTVEDGRDTRIRDLSDTNRMLAEQNAKLAELALSSQQQAQAKPEDELPDLDPEMSEALRS